MSEPSLQFSKELQLHETNIPGLVWLDLPVHGDNRGWFKENWQQEKMVAIGLPDFGPRQNNISFNATRGTTRGVHAEPWDKYVSVATGKIFGAWVDLRQGDTFGEKFTLEIDPSKAIFVPRGVGNAFQALEDGTAYSYLVNDHWVAGGENYAFVNLGCSKLNIQWPIPLDQAEVSEKDRNHPHISEVTPMKPRKTLILGSGGQLGKALREEFPEAEFADRSSFDITKPETWGDRNWRQYETIINAAAYTKVDLAETEGRADAWAINATAVGNLAKLATENQLTLVHISSDYVFDGSKEIHDEDEPFSPLGVYGQSKAAGDVAAATVPNHYIIRTSWVIGEGNNFVNVMKSLAEKDVNPSVVNDQVGRLTFTPDIARAVRHLLETKAPAGTYNVSSEGEPVSWFDIAQKVFELLGYHKNSVSGVSTMEYYRGKDGISPRPLNSTLLINKINETGFITKDMQTSLEIYLSGK
jgi:dTDP-4-dehydrorhamnose reductase